MDALHVSVLLHECIENLNIRPDGIYVDGTLGMGGHSEQIAARLTTGKLISIDRDKTAIERAGARLAPFGDRVQLVHGNFRDAAAILDRLGIDAVDGMLFDLGVSSPQLDESERGFSYMHDAPLDMRMDATEGLSAWNVINEWPEGELKRILYEYGEERYAPRIAGAIVRARAQQPIATTMELVDVIRSAMPGAALREKQHPAKRSFQDQAHFGAILDSSAQDVAGADGGNVQLGADDLGLRALTGTRCAQQDQIHRIIPFLC